MEQPAEGLLQGIDFNPGTKLHTLPSLPSYILKTLLAKGAQANTEAS